jgi:hypothetical protein
MNIIDKIEEFLGEETDSTIVINQSPFNGKKTKILGVRKIKLNYDSNIQIQYYIVKNGSKYYHYDYLKNTLSSPMSKHQAY